MSIISCIASIKWHKASQNFITWCAVLLNVMKITIVLHDVLQGYKKILYTIMHYFPKMTRIVTKHSHVVMVHNIFSCSKDCYFIAVNTTCIGLPTILDQCPLINQNSFVRPCKCTLSTLCTKRTLYLKKCMFVLLY